MDENEFYFDKIDNVLEREEKHLLEAQGQHHTSWDNHTLTLSTAAIGFCFTFLIINCPTSLWLFYTGVITFILSITSAMLNYSFSQRGFQIANNGHIQRRLQHEAIRYRVRKLHREVDVLKSEDNPETKIQAAKEQCIKDVEAIHLSYNSEEEKSRVNTNNNIVNTLNYAKTLFFLIGIIFISIFALLNLENIGNSIGT